VAYIMTSLMEEVIRHGTAAGVAARYNINFPAAGKTGTSRDGWFAGYTSELLCVVWVGFDDNRDLDLEGAHSAAPIWAEFMKRALQYREYRNTKQFDVPSGIVSIAIDPESGMPATPNCPKTRTEVYIAGTEPVGTCPLHGGRYVTTNVSGWDTSPGKQGSDGTDVSADAPPASPRRVQARAPLPPVVTPPPEQQPPPPPKPAEKKGFWRRVMGVFK
jgi:penicillin-binding protein 1B